MEEELSQVECYLRRNFLTDNPIIWEIVDDGGHTRNFGTEEEISRLLGTEEWDHNSNVVLDYDSDYHGQYTIR